jgi:hypothetical protein
VAPRKNVSHFVVEIGHGVWYQEKAEGRTQKVVSFPEHIEDARRLRHWLARGGLRHVHLQLSTPHRRLAISQNVQGDYRARFDSQTHS